MKPKPPQDLWAQMDAIVGDTFTSCDEGFTRSEFQERYKVGKSKASDQLRKLVQKGKLVVGRRALPTGAVAFVYRPK